MKPCLMSHNGIMKPLPSAKILNGSKPSSIHPHNSVRYVCVGCGFNDQIVAVLGGDRLQKCKNCNYTAMLPADALELEVLRVRVDFISITSNEVIERLREVIAHQASTIAELKGEPDPALVRQSNDAAAEILAGTKKLE